MDSTAHLLPRIDRRIALKWMFTAAASSLLFDGLAVRAADAAGAAAPGGVGYGTDPDLTRDYKPGELWPLTLSPSQRHTVAALCDVIIPADEVSGSASSVGVPDFIDEWISAPYPRQATDRKVVLAGLAWIDVEAMRRFGRPFAELAAVERAAICDDLSHEAKAAPEFKPAAAFFARFRNLTASGFYTTPEGMKDVGYVGNRPLASFDGPPSEALEKLGLA